jgi:dihydrolipoamide dehydrogenase
MVYDLGIIGGGPAGYLAAERAGHEGLSVLLMEKRSIGGVCLNEGCIPSKTLLHSAKIYNYAKHGEKYGVLVDGAGLNHETVVKRKDKIVRTLTAGIKAQLGKSKVEVVQAEAFIKGRAQQGFEISAEGKTYVCKRILVATGSVPVIPPIPGVKEGMEQGFVLTNREILDIKTVPGSLVIVGGGVIGLEMASYFNTAGSSVTVIEMLDHIAGDTESEISSILLKNYQKAGIDFKLSSKVVEINKGSVVYESNGEKISASCDAVLMSIGRKPFTQGLGLSEIGVELDKGGVKTDEQMRTNIPGIYAAGDVNGRSMLAHTAYREAEVAVNNMVGKKDAMSYEAVPAVIYTNPEVAGVGETEETARQKGIDCNLANISMRYSGRYVAEKEGGDGICKILTDKNTGRLIGVHMIGSYASEIIYGAAIMIEKKMRVDDIKKMIFPHPTVSEIIREGIFTLPD